MLYAVSFYKRWEDGTWEFVGYAKVFREQNRAIEFAHHSIENSFHACYYRVEAMSEEMVRAGGIEDLIESNLTSPLLHGIIITEQNKESNTMGIKNAWELNANMAKEVYGCYVDYEERFYICPNCEEPVYEEDWPEETMAALMCPYCKESIYEEE